MTGAGGGATPREVWAYNFNNGVHDYVKVRGVKLNLSPTCTAFDFTKDAAWATPATGASCNDTLYAYVEGWKF